MPVADLLQWASNGRQTGTIRVANADVTKMIYIQKGVIVSCTSTDPREFLGHFLVSQGAINENDLQGAIIDQDRHSGMLGQFLVQRGAITEERLNEMLRIKAEEAIFDLFTWTGGQFRFLDGELPGYELVPISLDVQGLVLEGMRRLDEWERIREEIPSVLCVPVAVQPLLECGPDGEADVDPGRTQRARIGGRRPVHRGHLSPYPLHRVLCLRHPLSRGPVKDETQDRASPLDVSGADEAATGMSGKALVKVARDHLKEGELEACGPPPPGGREPRAPRSRPCASRCRVSSPTFDDRLTDERDRTRVPSRNSRSGSSELSKLDLEPSEGFILSRIDGREPSGERSSRFRPSRRSTPSW